MKKMALDYKIDLSGPVDDSNGVDMDTNGENNGKGPNVRLTDEQLEVLAGKLAVNWEKLIPKFGLPSEKVKSNRIKSGSFYN